MNSQMPTTNKAIIATDWTRTTLNVARLETITSSVLFIACATTAPFYRRPLVQVTSTMTVLNAPISPPF
ncbi:MAG: hypothetical protein NTW66_01205 [Candidatus Magasanikbacteria bacterium]|nr:hypothetical protein [Candidatus Magasanikbacteria bacterium]